MLSSYYTVKQSERHVLIEQKSKFISHVSRAESEAAAQSFIEKVKKEHRDANHNCSAYMIGMQDQIQKANDDGEPAGTAGIPILEVLKKNHLKNTVIVVTRYFGGIKLGTGGLIRAYGSAASGGVKAAGIVKCILSNIMHIRIDYPLLGKVENELRSSPDEIKNIQYSDKVDVEVYVREDRTDSFKKRIANMTNGKAFVKKGSTVYIEKPL